LSTRDSRTIEPLAGASGSGGAMGSARGRGVEGLAGLPDGCPANFRVSFATGFAEDLGAGVRAVVRGGGAVGVGAGSGTTEGAGMAASCVVRPVPALPGRFTTAPEAPSPPAHSLRCLHRGPTT
jgi:hypothetical protein